MRRLTLFFVLFSVSCFPGMNQLMGLATQGANTATNIQRQRQEDMRRQQDAAARAEQRKQELALRRQQIEQQRLAAAERAHQFEVQRADALQRQAELQAETKAKEAEDAAAAAAEKQRALAEAESKEKAPIKALPGTDMEDIKGKLVTLDAQVSSADKEASYFDLRKKETQTICLSEPLRTHWGRGRGGGGRGRSRSYGGRGSTIIYYNNIPSNPEPAAVVKPATYKAPEPRCHKKEVTRGLVLRLVHPQNVHLKKGDYVRLQALALPATQAGMLTLMNPEIELITRGEKVLLGTLPGPAAE